MCEKIRKAGNVVLVVNIPNYTIMYVYGPFLSLAQWHQRWGHIQLSMFRAISNLTENEAQSWAAMRVCSFSHGGRSMEGIVIFTHSAPWMQQL